MVTYSGTIAELKREHLNLDYLKDSRHFHLSSFYLQLGLHLDSRTVQDHEGCGLTTSLDTNHDPEDTWQGGLLETLNTWMFSCPTSARPAALRELTTWSRHFPGWRIAFRSS